MTEINYSHDRSRYSFTENREGAKHDILVTPHATVSHYTHPKFGNGSTMVNISETLAEIKAGHNGYAVLVFACADGGQLQIFLKDTTPEALCDAVEAARLQTVEPADV